MRFLRTVIFALALGGLLAAPGCIKDQQAARTRLPGVDKPPEDRGEEKPPATKEEPPPPGA